MSKPKKEFDALTKPFGPFKLSQMGLAKHQRSAEAITYIGDCLEKLPIVEQERVLLAVAVLLDLPIVRDPHRRHDE
jgi:hypothetical protein